MNRRHLIAFFLSVVTGTTLMAGEKSSGTKLEKFLPDLHRLTLEQAVELAVRQNPDVLKQKQEIERTRGLVIEVRAQALPSLVVTSGYNQQQRSLIENGGGGGGNSSLGSSLTSSASSSAASSQQSGASANSTAQTTNFLSLDKSWNVTIQAQQTIYSGSVGPALKIAKLTQDSSVYTLRDVIDTVVDNVRKQFYDVLLNRELIKVQEESVELLGSQLKDQQNRFDAGTVPRFNVLQAEVALANAQPNLIRARNTYSISQLTLAKTLGLAYNAARPGHPIEAVGNLEIHDRHINLNDAIATAKARRPFLKVQRQSILIQGQNIKVALAGYQPQLTANAGYEVRNSRLSNDLDDIVNGWFFGVTGNWAIFDGLATYGKTKQARALLESARVNYEDAVHQVELEVQQAVDNLQQAKETRESQVKTVEQALEALRLSKERLDAGAGTQLDVLNAQVQLTSTRATELQARHDYNAALADFERVTATATQYDELFEDPLVKKARKQKADAQAKSKSKPLHFIHSTPLRAEEK